MGEVEVAAADGMTFSAEAGEFVVEVGPSGAGKTTALNVLTSLGACILDADAVYHDLLEQSRALREA